MNLFGRLKKLLPDPPLQVGTVLTYSNGVATVSIQGGFTTQVRGSANIGDRVFFKAGAIEGVAPALTLSVITI